MKTLIKNGRIVTAIDDYRTNTLIEDEQNYGISKINPAKIFYCFSNELW